jgi:uncharacterized damage-inducible protein DinB
MDTRRTARARESFPNHIWEERMTISEMLLPEFDREMDCTRRTLERIPEDKLAWQPHAKSMSLGRLAGHVAEIPWLAMAALKTPSLDLANRPAGHEPLAAQSRKQAVDTFDRLVSAARAAIAETSEAQWAEKWKMFAGEKRVFHGTRYMAVRAVVLNHLIHHRAQLGVCLRLNDVPLPSIYGPSADEDPAG